MADHSKTKDFEEKRQNTPDVGNSNVVGIILIIVISVVVLFTIYKINKNISSKHKIEAEQKQKNKALINSIRTFRMVDIDYQSMLIVKIKSNEQVKVQMTNSDWCPMWSDSNINNYDSKGTLRVLFHDSFIEGPTTSSGSNTFTFYNNSNKIVTIKVGRCKSKENCNINF